MKKISILLALALVVALTMPAVAEVEEVNVGGSIQVRAQLLDPGLDGMWWALCDDTAGMDWITQRTRINVDAKLSGNVRGFVELQSYDFWGLDVDDVELGAIDPVWPFGEVDSDEQKNYGVLAGQGNDNINLYQAYIEMNEIADYPLSLRIGRQELVYGREWLIGNNDAGVNFSGLSFDALKLSYNDEAFSVDAFWAKLVDLTSPLQLGLLGEVESDGDIDLYGVYGSYKGIENMVIDAYWMLVRNASTAQSFTPYAAFFNYTGVDTLHTIGARVAGGMELAGGMLDYNVEGAFQLGDNQWEDATGGEYGGWAVNAMAGYTFTDVAYSPRVEAEYAFFSGDDDAYDGDTDEFIRLFSDVHYGELNLGGNLDAATSNTHIFRIGASAVPVEKLTVKADFYYFLLADDDEDGWGKTFGLGQYTDPDNNPGFELDIAAKYQYTEDLNLTAGWAHFFVDDAMENSWGFDYYDEELGPITDDDDIDYLYVQASLTF
jgi:hypothetical protein